MAAVNNATKPVEKGSFSYKLLNKSVKNEEGGDIVYDEIVLSGKLEFITGFELEKSWSELEGLKSDIMVVNMKEVTFINSLGLNFLLNEYEKSVKKSKKFFIVHAGAYVMKVFSITRLDGIFKLLNDSDDCVKM